MFHIRRAAATSCTLNTFAFSARNFATLPSPGLRRSGRWSAGFFGALATCGFATTVYAAAPDPKRFDLPQAAEEVSSRLRKGGSDANVNTYRVEGQQVMEVATSEKNPFQLTVLESAGSLIADPIKKAAPNLSINLIYSLQGDGALAVEFSKDGDFTSQDVDTVVTLMRRLDGGKSTAAPTNEADVKRQRAAEKLRRLGVDIYQPEQGKTLDWNALAGYENVKEEIRDTVLLAMQRPEVYDSIVRGTREIFQRNTPRAVLFHGPPGTGKTTSARIMASQAGCPLVYVPLERIMSKWFGESEKQLATIFEACKELGDSLIFLDEIDAVGASRSDETHEASRRILSILLQKIDGFDVGSRTVVIAATNRPTDLDAALLSRFAVSIGFGLPGQDSRAQIFGKYAKQLSLEDCNALATDTAGVSGRNIKDICEYAERQLASKIVRGVVKEGTLPSLADYQAAVAARSPAKERIIVHDQAST